MRIQHNIMAMGAYRNYSNNLSALKKNLERLSSGYKINRAGDDAAGLAISEKMRAQITGLEVAQKNSKDGISLVQTAEGALTEVHDMLNRMYELAEQSANGTYDNEVDRLQLQKEVDSLRTEINRIADSSNFNGIKLLDGSMATKSASALASTTPLADSMLDGSSPTKAGAAEITVKLADATAAASKAMTYTTADGSAVSPNDKGVIELKMGGAAKITSASDSIKTQVTLGGKSYYVDGSKTAKEDQAAEWAKEFNADPANSSWTATADANGAITIEGKTDSPFGGDQTTNLGLTTAGGASWVQDGDGSGQKAKITITAAASAATPTQTGTLTVTSDAITVDLSVWNQGDSITINGKTYTHGGTSINDTIANLTSSLNADGYTVTTSGTTATIKATDATIAGNGGKGFVQSDGTSAATITAGTTTAADVADMYVNDGNKFVKVSDYYDVEVIPGGSATATARGDTDAIQNGDTIRLTAKLGGQIANETVANGLTSAAANLSYNTSSMTSALQGGVTVTNPGVNEGDRPVGASKTTYTMEFDLGKLATGQTIQIDDKTFEITLDASKTNGNKVGGTGSNKDNVLIVLGGLTPASGKTMEETIGDQIKAAITDATNGLDVTAGTGVWSIDTANTKVTPAAGSANAKFTLVLETASDADAVDDTNLGAGRVKVSDPTAIGVDYQAAAFTPSTPTSGSPFAEVEYTSDVLKNLGVGDKITIGDAVIEIVADSVTDLTATQVNISSANDATLAKIIEQQKVFDKGQVKFDKANGKITITGVATGQTGADLAKEIGTVSEYSKASSQANASLASNADSAMQIQAGTTAISALKGATISGSGATAVTLGEAFNITVNGSVKDDGYIIQEGDEVKFTAKVNGKLDDSIMSKFNYAGDITSLSSKNGYDEGSAATGNKTHYDLTIDLTKVAGGNSFTFGNVNGKSITFDLSYDKVPTKNDTVGSSDKNDISDNSNRVTINLFGKSTAEAQAEILSQVKTEMAKAGFTTTAATSGNKITLNVDANEEGEAYNLGNIRVSSQSGAFTNPVYNPAGSGAGGTEGTHAQISYKFDLDMLQEGDKLTIGDAVVHIGDETKTESVDGAVKFTVSLNDAKTDPNGKLAQIIEAAGFKNGEVRFDTDTKTMTIQGINVGEKAADLAKVAKVSLSSTTRASMETGGLKLQIGDTADDYNQMQVSINDCHADAMGIGDIDISGQDSAADAMKAIKSAINYVSDVRGTLGATQNRLDHTINNLSVMQENIQDAESTIRDTDIAEEMMAYTKNNILVQSAQAMLAQANQLPQGVLQLLQ